jgi:hypothetical protein
VLSGHSTAVASLSEGELEFMLHRDLEQDDGRGLGQPVVDRSRAETQMAIYFEPTGMGITSKVLRV